MPYRPRQFHPSLPWGGTAAATLQNLSIIRKAGNQVEILTQSGPSCPFVTVLFCFLSLSFSVKVVSLSVTFQLNNSDN